MEFLSFMFDFEMLQYDSLTRSLIYVQIVGVRFGKGLRIEAELEGCKPAFASLGLLQEIGKPSPVYVLRPA